MTLQSLDIELLRAFITVAEAGSFTTAACVLSRTQSAVSQQVARLEKNLDVQLFNRTGRKVTLSDQGERLLGFALRMLELNNQAVCHFSTEHVCGKLRLGVCEDMIPGQLPRLLARFSSMHPDMELVLHTDLSTRLKMLLEEGELDLVLAKEDEVSGEGGRVLWQEPLVWIAARDYIFPDNATPLPLVLLPSPCSYRSLAMHALGTADREYNVCCTSHSLMGLQAAVAGGLGISILGRSFLRDGLKEVPPGVLPDLPSTKIALFGEQSFQHSVTDSLVEYLMDGLSVS